MIIQCQPPNLVLITQPDHAALAADLLGAWRDRRFLQIGSRDDLLHAIREHDNGWLESDARPGLDRESRRPYDFIGAPTSVKQGIWPRGIARLREASPYAAALVAQHALTIFQRYAGDPEWTAFFESITRTRDELLERIDQKGPVRRAQFEADYQWLHLADVLSLIFCNGWTQPFDEAGYQIILTGGRLRITPDPFDSASVRFRPGRPGPPLRIGRGAAGCARSSAGDLVDRWRRRALVTR